MARRVEIRVTACLSVRPCNVCNLSKNLSILMKLSTHDPYQHKKYGIVGGRSRTNVTPTKSH